MTKILNFALKIKGGGREGGTCEVLRPCHPLKIWNVHQWPLSFPYSWRIEKRNIEMKVNSIKNNSVSYLEYVKF